MTCLVALGLLSAVSGNASAATYSISFPEVYGDSVYPDDPDPVGFDFGVEFASIQSAKLSFIALGTEGLLYECFGFPGNCQYRNYGPELSYWLGYEPDFGFNTPHGEVGLTGTPTSYTIDISAESDFLLDGQGTLHIEQVFQPIFFGPYDSQTIITPSTFSITEFSLNIEATAVPVPAAAGLFVLGISCLLPLSRRRRADTGRI